MNEKPMVESENVISLHHFQRAASHVRPCGVEEEFLDDPLRDLLDEYSTDRQSTQEFLTEDPPPFWSEQAQQSLGIHEILKEAQKQMTPVQRLRFAMIKTRKSLKELHYYNREVKTFLGL